MKYLPRRNENEICYITLCRGPKEIKGQEILILKNLILWSGDRWHIITTSKTKAIEKIINLINLILKLYEDTVARINSQFTAKCTILLIWPIFPNIL